jgi:hypothetical protein
VNCVLFCSVVSLIVMTSAKDAASASDYKVAQKLFMLKTYCSTYVNEYQETFM